MRFFHVNVPESPLLPDELKWLAARGVDVLSWRLQVPVSLGAVGR